MSNFVWRVGLPFAGLSKLLQTSGRVLAGECLQIAVLGHVKPDVERKETHESKTCRMTGLKLEFDREEQTKRKDSFCRGDAA